MLKGKKASQCKKYKECEIDAFSPNMLCQYVQGPGAPGVELCFTSSIACNADDYKVCSVVFLVPIASSWLLQNIRGLFRVNHPLMQSVFTNVNVTNYSNNGVGIIYLKKKICIHTQPSKQTSPRVNKNVITETNTITHALPGTSFSPSGFPEISKFDISKVAQVPA